MVSDCDPRSCIQEVDGIKREVIRQSTRLVCPRCPSISRVNNCVARIAIPHRGSRVGVRERHTLKCVIRHPWHVRPIRSTVGSAEYKTLPNSRPRIGVCKTHRLQAGRDHLADPCSSTISGFGDASAHHVSDPGTWEADCIRKRQSGPLPLPGCSAVGGAERSVRAVHGSSRIRVCERNPVKFSPSKIPDRSVPSRSSIRRSKKRAVPPDNKRSVGVNKTTSVELRCCREV